jgi:hypothetical protein
MSPRLRKLLFGRWRRSAVARSRLCEGQQLIDTPKVRAQSRNYPNF